MKLRIVTEFTISDQAMIDMLDTAGYGINYWASSMEIDGENVTVVESEPPLGGDTPRVLRTNFLNLRDAFVRLASPDQPYVNETIHGYFVDAVRHKDDDGDIDAGDIDSDAADCLVQVALFGEVLYG